MLFEMTRGTGSGRQISRLRLNGVYGMDMKGYAISLEKETKKNTDFRRVLYTGKHSQLVLMNLRPGEEIGEETHEDIDQFFRFERKRKSDY